MGSSLYGNILHLFAKGARSSVGLLMTMHEVG